MKELALTFAALLFLLSSAEARVQPNDSSGKVEAVDSVDLSRYAGTWYEISRIPNPFQKQCAMNTTATYRVLKNGEMEVVNRCVKSDGSPSVAEGVAKVVDKKTNAKLEVSFVSIFGIHLFWGDYWIIGLDKDYRYAVVGTPSRKYGWVLSRTPALTSEQKKSVEEILESQGYRPLDFVPTDQTQPDSSGK